jgi:hypothetical protein
MTISQAFPFLCRQVFKTLKSGYKGRGNGDEQMEHLEVYLAGAVAHRGTPKSPKLEFSARAWTDGKTVAQVR